MKYIPIYRNKSDLSELKSRRAELLRDIAAIEHSIDIIERTGSYEPSPPTVLERVNSFVNLCMNCIWSLAFTAFMIWFLYLMFTR